MPSPERGRDVAYAEFQLREAIEALLPFGRATMLLALSEILKSYKVEVRDAGRRAA